MWGLVIVGILLLAFVVLTRARRMDLPFPGKIYPILGATIEFVRNFPRMPDYVVECAEKTGWKTFGIPVINLDRSVPFGPVFALSPENVKHILATNFDNYIKGEVFHTLLRDLTGDGIFASDGERWMFHRKVASNMFTRSLMRTSGDAIQTHTLKLTSILANHAYSGTPVDIQNLLFRLTMDAFASIAFGVDLDELNTPHAFATSMDTMSSNIVYRFSNPLGRLARFFKFGYERTIQNASQIMNEFAFDVISHKRRDASEGKLGPDLISRFLAGATTNGVNMTNQELRDVVINFILAGRDTTAGTMSYVIWELMRNYTVLQRVQNESAQFLMPQDKDVMKHPACLPYLHAVVLETLRLHPQVPLQVKFAIKDDVWPDGTKIRASQPVVVTAYAMGRNPNVWGKDATDFRPERWLDDQGAPLPEPSAFQFVTFNAGRRICLGKDLAMMEMKIVLAQILQQFEFLPFGKMHDGAYKRSVTLPLQGKLMVTIKVRDVTAA
eukprot:c18535_g1_i5.p1 GENE.c18535_g1_i5~~c18535_g1_i5.p1  ORF type:complete len:497 (+),score=85.47 c18535_g1_i5:752-2242(+)